MNLSNIIVINNDLMSITRPAAEFGHQVDIFQAAQRRCDPSDSFQTKVLMSGL